MPAISKDSLRKVNHQQRSRSHAIRHSPYDRGLLGIVAFAAVVMLVSIILVPYSMENETFAMGPDAISKKDGTPGSGQAGDKPHHTMETVDETTPQKHQDASQANLPAQAKVPGRTKDAYHTVFSTGCSTFQDWQSYVFFFHMLRSGQEGPVTRIVSGCKEEDEKTLTEIFEKEIATMAPGRFRLHFTPDFSKVKPPKKFKYFNKPFGMRHWMREVLGYPDSHESDDTIIILLDPDQILMRPFTNDFSNSSEKWRLKEGYKLKVEHGSPFAQQYGFGIQWKHQVDLEHVFDGPSPVTEMTDKEAKDYYAAMGPPYVATGKDMYTIVSRWADIVPRVLDNYPHLLAEMFAFNLAAAHHGLRHTVAHSFMVSDVYAGGEGWKLIDAVPPKDICYHFPKSEYPHVIHYCQRYYLGKWFIGKYKLRKDFISCESPLLVMPPEDLAEKGYHSAILPDKSKKELKPKTAKEHAFMLCTMIRALNEAALYYKDHHCDKASANYAYSYTFHKNMTMPDDPQTQR